MKKLKIYSLPILVTAIIFATGVLVKTVSAEESAEPTLYSDQMQDLREKKMETKREMEEKRLQVKTEMEDQKEEMKKLRDEKVAEMQEKMEERKEKLKEDVRKRVERHADGLVQRIEASIERVEKLIERVASRLEKVAERGVDTTEAKRFIEEARNETVLARGDLELIKTKVSEVLDSETPREAYAGLRELVKSVKTHLQAAHKNLRNAVESVKAGINKIENDDSQTESDN